jgi:hypothetical protein
MPLGKFPYRHRLISKNPDATGGYILTFDVLDADDVVKQANASVNVGGQSLLPEIRDAITQQVENVAIVDAGGVSQLLDAIIAQSPSKEWATGDPAYTANVIPLNGVSIATWTNQPAALTETPQTRLSANLALYNEVRLSMNITVAGVSGALLRLQYTTDLSGATGWTYLNGGTGPEIAIGSTGIKTSPWATIVTLARAEVLLRLVGINGNGNVDPAFAVSTVQLR